MQVLRDHKSITSDNFLKTLSFDLKLHWHKFTNLFSYFLKKTHLNYSSQYQQLTSKVS